MRLLNFKAINSNASYGRYQPEIPYFPAETKRNDNVIITSKRRRNGVLT